MQTVINRHNPYPIYTDTWNQSSTSLFLSISSYRDPLCPLTLFNAFTKATYPHRLSIGIVQQNDPNDLDCLEEYCQLIKKNNITLNDEECSFKKQIRILRIDAKDAKGKQKGI